MSGGEPSESEQHAELTRLARERLGGEVEAFEDIAPGLGHRRFVRLRIGGGRVKTAIARLESTARTPSTTPAVAAEPELEPIRAWLEAEGMPVPARYGASAEHGIELLEDLGDTSLEQAARDATAAERTALYEEACSLAARMQALAPPTPPLPAFERSLDAALIASKAHKLVEWTLPHVLGRSATAVEREVVEHAFAWIADQLGGAPQRLAHRDFKAANLHLRARGAARLAMIDLQGAFLAPPEYDLVCLLRDSHVRLPEHEVEHQLRRIRPDLPDAPQPEVFDRRFTLITLIRVGKDVSHYLHAADQRDDRRYLEFVPTAFHNLGVAAAHAAGWDPRIERLADLLGTLAARPRPEDR